MSLTVVIPTYKRIFYLQRALSALRRQVAPGVNWEVLVVDNAGDSAIQQLIKVVSETFPVAIRYVHEPRLGLNYARNTGVSHASGKLLAFLDDDMVPRNDWIRQIIAIFSEYGDADCIGGKVEPLWETTTPYWFSERFLARLAMLDISPVVCRVRFPQYICGGNVAFKTSIFKQVGPFAETLDRRGTRLISSGEVELCLRIERAGGNIYYCPGLVTRHTINRERTKGFYLLRRGYWQAVTDAIIDIRHFSFRRYTEKLASRLRDLCHNIPRLIKALLFRDQPSLMIIVDKFVFTVGYVHGILYAAIHR